MIREWFRKFLIRLGIYVCVKCGSFTIEKHGFPAGPVNGVPGMTRNESNMRIECLVCGAVYKVP